MTNLPRSRRCPPLALAMLAALASGPATPAFGQGDLARRPGPRFTAETSHTADALLRNAAAHARDGQWAEAIEIYERVIQQFGEKVADLPRDDPGGDPTGETTLKVDLRLYCQRQLAALPPEALALYRGRVDAQAERLVRQGVESRDRSALRKVVQQMFCSSWGDDALDLLGDLAFQEGRFAEALGYYRQVVPDSPGAGLGLAYPDPDVDRARVAAKKLLCLAALGDADSARGGLAELARSFPEAAGDLAGRSGPLAEVVAAALGEDGLEPPPVVEARWPTFAGSPSRTKVAPGPIDVGSFQWKVELEPSALTRFAQRGGQIMLGGNQPVPADRLLAYHPIVLGDQVVVANDRQVAAYNLGDRPSGGAAVSVPVAWKHEHEAGFVPNATRYAAQVPRHTLTAYGDRIFARMGQPAAPAMRQAVPSQSVIVAVDRAQEGKLLWKRPAATVTLDDRRGEAGSRTAAFEGAPVADAGSVYVALTEAEALMKLYVACLDAETGATRWVRYVGSAAGLDDGMRFGGGLGGIGGIPGEVGHRLLSLDGPTLYYQTNLGAVAAIDAETGSIRWLATYPRIERADGGSSGQRELNPAIVHDGLVLVAPDDARSVFAFDAATGRLAWKSEPVPDEVRLAHLLGVARGRLVATGDRVLWFDLKTGKLAKAWPEGGRSYEGFGRGLLAGDRVYWPTRGEIHVLDQETGLRTDPPIQLQESYGTTGGNLVAGDGYLIVAQPDALVVFCQNSRLIQRYRDEIAKAPDQAANYFRLARAAESTGQDELALASFDRVVALARPSETLDGTPLVDATRDLQHRLLMRMGRAAVDRSAWPEAADRFEAAATAARAPRDILSARLELADVQAARGEPGEAVANLQGLLGEPRLRGVVLAGRDGRRSVRSDLLVSGRLDALVREGGRSLYAPFDREARALLERGVREEAPQALEEVARSYPAAEAVPDAWLALGRMHLEAGRPAEAARAFKRLLAAATDGETRGRALWNLADAYERQGLLVPARDALAEALARHPDAAFAELGPDGRLGPTAGARLDGPPFDRMVDDRAEPSLPIPLGRRWSVRWAGSSRPLTAAGVPPSAEASRVFLTEGTRVRPVDPTTGSPTWSADLGGEPAWVGYLADRVVAATSARVVGLDLASGAVDWQFDLASPTNERAGDHPLARPAAESGEVNPGRFQGFRIVGGRVFCLRGDRSLLALDGDTGQVDWSWTPAAGTISPRLLVGPERIALLSRGPNVLQVLETATGRPLAAYPRPDTEDWLRDPMPVDDDRLALVVDRRTIVLFDLSRGDVAWTFRESAELPRNGPPRLLADAGRLLVLHDGNVLLRLDPGTGSKLWATPLGSNDLSERPESLAVDAERFYCAIDRAGGQTLLAVDLAEGRTAWQAWLFGPKDGWSIALSEACVVAYPDGRGAASREPDRLPVVLRRRDTGRLVQRLLFPATAPGLAVRLAPRGALVSAEGGLWALGDPHAVDAGGGQR